MGPKINHDSRLALLLTATLSCPIKLICLRTDSAWVLAAGPALLDVILSIHSGTL